EVSVEELAQAPVVVLGSADVELVARNAEGVLDVDGDQADPEAVLERRAKPVLLGPGLSLLGALLIRNPPDLADAPGLEVRRDRKLGHAVLVCPTAGAVGCRYALYAVRRARSAALIPEHCVRLASDRHVLAHHLPALAQPFADAAGEDDSREAEVTQLRDLGRGRGAQRGEGGDAGGRRLPTPSEALRATRSPRAQGDPPLRASGHRQNAPCESRRSRVRSELLLPERVGVRRDVRRARC